ncbi:MAG: ATP-binding protein [Vulcanimicrobiota bacterium]
MDNPGQLAPQADHAPMYRRRLVLGYAVSIMLVVVFCGWGAYWTGRVRRTTERLVARAYQSTIAWDRMVYALERQDNALLHLLVDASPRSTGVFADNAMTFEQMLKEAQRSPSFEGEREASQRIEKLFGEYLDAFETIHELHREGSATSAIAAYNAVAQPLFLQIRTDLIEVRDQYYQRISDVSYQVERESRFAEISMAVAAICFVGLGGAFLRFLSGHLLELERERARNFAMERQAKEAAEEANASKNRFLATVTHELRTPLTGILGNLELLEENIRKPRDLEYLAAIHSSSKVLLYLVNDLLDLSRMEAGRLEVRAHPFEPTELLEELIAALTPVAAEKGIQLELELHDQLPQGLLGDSQRIRQILLNLVGNAIKFTSQGGVRVGVRAQTEQTCRLIIAVTDTGPGIAASELKSIFKPFHQLDSFESRSQGGAGLGLAIVRSLVKEMGGEVAVDSKVGEGTTFTVELELPRCEVAERPEELDSERQPLPPARVLLVEDNPISRRVIGLQLSRMGLEVTSAADGQEALDCFESQDFDLVLMDCQLPVLDGYETTRRIRQSPRPEMRGLTILALTAHALEGEFERCLQAGMDDFLTKPVDSATLERVLRHWLTRQESGRDLAGGGDTQ